MIWLQVSTMWSWRLVPLPLENWTTAVTFLLPLRLLSIHIRCLWKPREGGKIRYMECQYIVSSTDIERCNLKHLVTIVCIPCVYIRRTWYIRHHSASALSAMRLLWNCPRIPLQSCHPLLSTFILQASNIRLFNIPATHYLCPFFSILLSQIFDRLVDFWSPISWRTKYPVL